MIYLCFGSFLESIDTGIENRGFFFNSFMLREYRAEYKQAQERKYKQTDIQKDVRMNRHTNRNARTCLKTLFAIWDGRAFRQKDSYFRSGSVYAHDVDQTSHYNIQQFLNTNGFSSMLMCEKTHTGRQTDW